MDPKVHSRCEWKNHLSPATLMMGLAINFTCIERQTMTDSRQILLYNRKVINKNIRMCMCYSSLFGWYYWNQMCMIWPKHLLILMFNIHVCYLTIQELYSLKNWFYLSYYLTYINIHQLFGKGLQFKTTPSNLFSNKCFLRKKKHSVKQMN